MNPRKCIIDTVLTPVETITTESRGGKLIYLDRIHGNQRFNVKQTGKLCAHPYSGWVVRIGGQLFAVSGNTDRVRFEPIASWKLPFSMSAFDFKRKLEDGSAKLKFAPADPRKPKTAKAKVAKTAKAKVAKVWYESFGMRATRAFQNAKIQMDRAGFAYSLETEALFWECFQDYTASLANRKADSFV